MLPGRTDQNLLELHWGVFPGEWLASTAAVVRASVRTVTIAAHPNLALASEDALIQITVFMGVSHPISQNALRRRIGIALLAEQEVIGL